MRALEPTAEHKRGGPRSPTTRPNRQRRPVEFGAHRGQTGYLPSNKEVVSVARCSTGCGWAKSHERGSIPVPGALSSAHPTTASREHRIAPDTRQIASRADTRIGETQRLAATRLNSAGTGSVNAHQAPQRPRMAARERGSGSADDTHNAAGRRLILHRAIIRNPHRSRSGLIQSPQLPRGMVRAVRRQCRFKDYGARCHGRPADATAGYGCELEEFASPPRDRTGLVVYAWVCRAGCRCESASRAGRMALRRARGCDAFLKWASGEWAGGR